MKITKRLAISPASENAAVFMTRSAYASVKKPVIFQEYSELAASDTFGDVYEQRSEDNGATWSASLRTWRPETRQEGTLRRGEFAHVLDSARGRLIRFSERQIYPDPKKYTIEVAWQTTIEIEFSTDEGRTFSPPQQLIVEGGNAREWAPGVCYGKNCAMISFSQPFFDSSGCCILPAQWLPPTSADQNPYRYPLQAACFLGDAGADGSITWSMSERVRIDPSLSVRGLCEPTISEISGGRLLMISRGSNADSPEMPGRKWAALSSDGGRSWSEVRPLGYETGELFYSPATGSRLIRSSFNGKLYWIGNIIPQNPEGNSPRHPLCIVEVDEEKPALRKETVFTIDNRGPNDTPRVQLSNFHVYEDRETGDFVLLMARIFERSETLLLSPAYEYRINL
jgi:hypothetical protein